MSKNQPTTEKVPLCTYTGEYYQPVRIYYKISDAESVTKNFSQLSCMKKDFLRRRWVWLYTSEALRLVFQVPYKDIDKNLHPIVLGSFFFKPQNIMVCDLRSVDRALKAIEFFHNYIPRNVAEFVQLTLFNRYFENFDPQVISFDSFFEDYPKPCEMMLDLENFMQDLKKLSVGQRLVKGLKYLTQIVSKPFPEIESFTCNFYEEGLSSMRDALTIRKLIAREFWKGNNISPFDLAGLLLEKDANKK